MGCCGCSLYISTVTAGILTLLDCVLFLTFDVLVIVFLSVKGHWITDNKDFNKFIAGFSSVTDSTTITILIGIKVGLRIVWFISGILLLIGNAKEYRKFINVWKYLTVCRIIYSMATMIYALVSLVGKIKDLFVDNHKWSDNYNQVSHFVILMDFLELSPIWLIILIALVIYVHQRSQEIESKKNQPNHWGNFSNGGPTRNGTSNLAHPVSLAHEPNPFTVGTDHNRVTAETNNNELSELRPTNAPLVTPNAIPSAVNHFGPTTSTHEPIKPILEVNGVISIPRVTLKPTKAEFDSHHEKKRHVSSLVKRSSHYDMERDVNKIPKRNNSYHLAQSSGHRSHAYDNRAFDRKTETDLYKPVLIKRASTRRSHNQ